MNIGDKIVVTNTDYPHNVPNGSIMTVVYVGTNHVQAVVDSGGIVDGYKWYIENHRYEPYYSERTLKAVAQLNEPLETHKMAEDTPKTWGQMTPEEKGALLLAHHEGKTIEVLAYSDGWNVLAPTSKFTPEDNRAYRIKPKVKRETVTLYGAPSKHVQWCLDRCGLDTHVITFDLIDGIPDPDSIKITGV